MHDDHPDHDDGGLTQDLKLIGGAMKRRQLLQLMLAAGALPWLGCGGAQAQDGEDPGDGSCSRIPQETAGPYPADGSNGPNVLTQSGIVRQDIRSSIGASSGSAQGIPLTVTLTVVDSSAGCAPLAGYAVYLWHCDREGRYSLYSSGVTEQNYLRGVQATDANGQLTFTTVFPGCYAGRWPHIHFEVYPSLAAATAVGNKVATSQLALPQAACSAAYATAGYEASVRNLSGVSLASDNVFAGSASSQLANVTGDAASGYVATLTVGVDA